jgi:hypothetical protein
MKSTKLTFCTTLLVLGIASAVRADVSIDSFEGASPSLYGPATATPIVPGSVVQGSLGVTDGSSSMQVGVDATGTWAWQLSKTYGASTYTDWYNHNKLQFDIFRAPGANGWNFDMALAINTVAGWNQVNTLFPSWPWLNAGQSSSLTVTVDYSAYRNTAPTPGSPNTHYWQLNLLPRSGQGGTIYIDNVRFVEAVPEPSVFSLVLLALPAAFIVRSRTQKD